MKIFKKVIPTGIAHGTVTVLLGGGSYEVTTYRIDGVYEDARHPKQVTFTPDLREDLRRRDFTINAMAYNDRNELVDLFGGREDLERKVIRCVGDAGERFSEDALRILRAVRFSAQLNFSIDPDTERAAAQLAQNLRKISVERIAQELIKLLISDHPEKLRRAYELGITGMFLPEFDQIMNQRQDGPHHIYTVGVHTLHTVMSIRPDPILRLTMLLHDMGKLKTARQDAEGIWHFPDLLGSAS